MGNAHDPFDFHWLEVPDDVTHVPSFMEKYPRFSPILDEAAAKEQRQRRVDNYLRTLRVEDLRKPETVLPFDVLPSREGWWRRLWVKLHAAIEHLN
jgi:hypothetical protein